MSLPALIVFVKNPQAGRVKTRIAADAGPEKALEIYLELLDITRSQALSFDSGRYIFYSDHIDDQDAWSDQFSRHLQDGSDLGERMFNAFFKIFSSLPPDEKCKVILMGSDCPFINATLLEQASTQLDEADCVIGPAVDGGYYLIGFSVMPDKRIFSGISWSTSSVYSNTIKKLAETKYSFSVLPMLSDVDTLADWQRYRNANKGKK
jgi:rSAM/selenodomain-associated transferase 1